MLQKVQQKLHAEAQYRHAKKTFSKSFSILGILQTWFFFYSYYWEQPTEKTEEFLKQINILISFVFLCWHWRAAFWRPPSKPFKIIQSPPPPFSRSHPFNLAWMSRCRRRKRRRRRRRTDGWAFIARVGPAQPYNRTQKTWGECQGKEKSHSNRPAYTSRCPSSLNFPPIQVSILFLLDKCTNLLAA